MNISAIIIARNEEENIEKCIKALSFVDEIIVINNDSIDGTISIARKLGAKIYPVSGLDFSYLRNVGKEKASSSWLLYIDADEQVTRELAEDIKKIKDEKKLSAYSLRRKNYYLGHPWPKIEEIVRLIKKDSLIGWQGSLHESPVVAGKIGKLQTYLNHYTHRDLSSMVTKTNEWSEIEARLRYQNNHPKMTWWRFIRVMLIAFYNSYIRDEGWKVGVVGIIEGLYQAFSMFITYAKLWEMQNRTDGNKNDG